MMKIKTAHIIFGAVALLILINHGCKKDDPATLIYPVPENPYQKDSSGNDVITGAEVDSSSFLGLHKYIFQPKCAQPACHDGAFEPDFRTVQSAYSTLVYHRVVKSDDQGKFTYRVVPGDPEISWLHERITTDDPVLGRMPLYDTLYPAEINLIKQWILNGAPDIFGNSPTLPNPEPSFFGIVAYNSNDERIDTNRLDDEVISFLVPPNETVDIWFGFIDLNPGKDTLLGYQLGYNKIKFASGIYGFDAVPEKPLIVETTPHFAPAFGGQDAPYFQHYQVNTGDYQVGETVFMRLYITDPDHSRPTEFFQEETSFYLHGYLSFKVDSL